ncbi:hypothetical protein VNI00_014286 [Paramarasmius palmivorus]|uniref:LysM domain-containing protein n=1 Tax=Paramarasmius palmivorus TaxID=297713 RepID=A0AAW0BVJ9_9AGAR
MSTLLCLACSSSLPPRTSQTQKIFITPCCNQPICPSCITANPRLERYNPCLMCLGGVDAVSKSTSKGEGNEEQGRRKERNVDGSVRDEDLFVLGDDDEQDEDEDEGDGDGHGQGDRNPETPPAYTETLTSQAGELDGSRTKQDEAVTGEAESEEQRVNEAEPPTPRRARYHIKRGDTLQGIVLKFGVNREDLCRLNNLPLSTLTTTPHLLHTRTTLLLPDSARITGKNKENVSYTDAVENPEVRKLRERERAGKRLQSITKEVDWDVAKAYVALADGDGEEEEHAAKRKELGSGSGKATLESRAVDRYLDDIEWEESEMRAGRGPSTMRGVPVFRKE